jgi:glycosyltransferase involved in cell wall biosynthesis
MGTGTHAGNRKIAWLSPLPPQRSGIAYYSYSLIKALKPHLDIDLYYDTELPALELRNEFDVYPIHLFPERREAYDEVIYHLGNHSGFHKTIYQLAWKYPGTIVLHDYNLSAFMHDAFYLQADWQLYEQALVDSNGERDHHGLLGLVPQLRRNVNGLPMSHAVVNKSRKVIVHHQWLKHQFNNNDHIDVIPLFGEISFSPTLEQIARFREKFSIKDTHFLISCLGFVNRNKLPELQVKVVKKLLAQGFPVHLLFAGETSPEVRALQEEVEASEFRKYITFAGYLDETDYLSALFAADVVINLRNPSMGEGSLTLVHALAAAKPTIISDANQYTEFPDKVCWKLTHDENEAELLCDYLTVLLSNKNVRAALSENAVNYVKSVFAIEKIVSHWLRVISK